MVVLEWDCDINDMFHAKIAFEQDTHLQHAINDAFDMSW